MVADLTASLEKKLAALAAQAELKAWAVAVHDLETGAEAALQGDQLFHAASTYKAAVLLALLHAVSEGTVALTDQLHVRNRFFSVVDGAPYRIEGERDGDAEVHRHLGRSLPLGRLAHAMITRSSNLATNLLLDFLTVARVRATLGAAGLRGVEVRRGVEDLAAHEKGINNEVTAAGLVALFRTFAGGDFLPPALREEGLRILHAQEFRRMLPARLPSGVKVAHKTGEISTHAHDAGLVYPPGRQPYAVAILTESAPGDMKRIKAAAEMSAAIYQELVPVKA